MIFNKNIGRIKIDDARIDAVCAAYFQWKDLNSYVKSNSTRGINLPDVISEPMGCYSLGFLWNRGKETGDAYDPITDKRIEFKATSRFEGDLSSFGPKEKFDDLYFLRFNLHENMLYIYHLNVNFDDLGKYPANKKETVQSQRNEGRRPHISLQKLFVDAKNLQPIVKFDIRRCKVLKQM